MTQEKEDCEARIKTQAGVIDDLTAEVQKLKDEMHPKCEELNKVFNLEQVNALLVKENSSKSQEIL